MTHESDRYDAPKGECVMVIFNAPLVHSSVSFHHAPSSPHTKPPRQPQGALRTTELDSEIRLRNPFPISGSAGPIAGVVEEGGHHHRFRRVKVSKCTAAIRACAPRYTLETLPTVLRSGPYRFFFYSADRDEPPHVHVEREDSEAKFWLDPVSLERSRGLGRAELLRIEALVAENRVLLEREWHEYFRN